MTPERKGELRQVANELALSKAYGYIAMPVRELLDALDAAQARAEALAADAEAWKREGCEMVAHVTLLREALERMPSLAVAIEKAVDQGTVAGSKAAWAAFDQFVAGSLAADPRPLGTKYATALALAEAYRDAWIRVDGDVPHAAVRDEAAAYIQALAEQAKEAENG